MGTKELIFASNQAGEEEETLSDKEVITTVTFSLLLGVGVFMVLPSIIGSLLFHSNKFAANVVEAIMRLVIFIGYIWGISFMKDIQRVFQYHGAEHKTIFAYEAGLPLEVSNVRGFTTLHPRCGTNFLMIVMIISMFVFTFLGWPNLLERILSRIVLMPVIAGISYEIIRYAGTHIEHSWVRTAILPGLYLQKLTTREPDDSQIEVAIAALKAVLPEEEPALTEAEVSVGEECDVR